MFTLGTSVIFIHSTGAPALVQVVGYSEHTDPHCRIKAFLWKVVTMFRNSRSNGAGPRNFTPSHSWSEFHYIGTLPFICRCALTLTSPAHHHFLCFVILFSAAMLCLTVCVYTVVVRFPGGWGGVHHLATVPQGMGGARTVIFPQEEEGHKVGGVRVQPCGHSSVI